MRAMVHCLRMKKQVVILGAGISGLSLAYFLKKRYGDKITLQVLEKSERVGGWIQTDDVEGFLFERGPRTLRASGDGLETLALIEELKLQEEVLGASKEAQARYVVLDGKLEKVPGHLLACLTAPLLKGIKKDLMKGCLKRGVCSGDLSLERWADLRFGPLVKERLLAPICLGIYGSAELNALSLRSCFPSLYAWETGKKPLLSIWHRRRKLSPFMRQRKRETLFSFRQGLITLPLALEARLPGVVQKEVVIQSLVRDKEQVVLELEGREEIRADYLFSALPWKALKELGFERRGLSTLPHTSLGIVQMGWHGKVLPLNGFGYLIPPREGSEVLGVVFDSEIFSHPGKTQMTLMMKQADSRLALDEVQKRLGIQQAPDVLRAYSAKEAIAQYPVGFHEERRLLRSRLKAWFPRFFLTGASFDGVSVSSCIAQAKRIVDGLPYTL